MVVFVLVVELVDLEVDGDDPKLLVIPVPVPKTPPPPPPAAVVVPKEPPAVVVPKEPPVVVPATTPPVQQLSPAGQEVPSEQQVQLFGIQLLSEPHCLELAVHPATTPLQVWPVGQQPTESQ